MLSEVIFVFAKLNFTLVNYLKIVLYGLEGYLSKESDNLANNNSKYLNNAPKDLAKDAP